MVTRWWRGESTGREETNICSPARTLQLRLNRPRRVNDKLEGRQVVAVEDDFALVSVPLDPRHVDGDVPEAARAAHASADEKSDAAKTAACLAKLEKRSEDEEPRHLRPLSIERFQVEQPPRLT